MSITVIDVHQDKVVSNFHTFVQPTNAKELHKNTIEKTGIQNNQIFPDQGSVPNIYLAL